MMEKIDQRLFNKTEKLNDLDDRIGQFQKEKNKNSNFRFFSSLDCSKGNTIPYRRRDYYKVNLLRGTYIVHFKDESIQVTGTSLSFFSPLVPYTIETVLEEENGGYFIFTESYYDNYFRQSIHSFPLFAKDSIPIFTLDESQAKDFKALFDKIERHYHSSHAYRDDLIRNTINEIMLEANRCHPATERNHRFSSKERIYNIFNEVLDRQFPLDSFTHNILKTPNEYAQTLNVHVNYLNRTLKEVTGKSTRMLLQERLIKECIILLKHTNTSISEIAYSAGFKDVSHFNHFFRTQVNAKPSDYRK